MGGSSSAPITRVVLVGLMASGKTLVGSALARRLAWRYLDNDDLLAAQQGMTASEINERFGSQALHRLEADSLLVALDGEEPAVVSAAASTIEDARCRAALSGPGVFVVWLRADPHVLAPRIRPGQQRPMLEADVERLLESQQQARAPLYGAIADLVIDVLASTPDQLADEIAVAVRG